VDLQGERNYVFWKLAVKVGDGRDHGRAAKIASAGLAKVMRWVFIDNGVKPAITGTGTEDYFFVDLEVSRAVSRGCAVSPLYGSARLYRDSRAYWRPLPVSMAR